MAPRACLLPERGVLRVRGLEAESFLQGLITQNMGAVRLDQAAYSLLQTPQGKFLFDMFLIEDGHGYLIDCEAARAKDLLKRLFFYKLRAKVEITDQSHTHAVAALPDDKGARAGAAEDAMSGVIYVDPRLAGLGKRAILPREAAEDCLTHAGYELCPPSAYHARRIELGVPEAGYELQPEKTFPLEANLDLLNAIDFKKGCFVGQEVTSRTKRRGQIRKRLVPARMEGPPPEPGRPVVKDGRNVGEVLSHNDETALLSIKLAEAEEEMRAGDALLHLYLPDWADFTLGSEDSGGAKDPAAGEKKA